MKLLNKLFGLGIFILFFLLILKNPYSHRNLISNLEPFPDSQHYITAPLCFINSGEWKLCRLNNLDLEGSKPSVPPLYSLYIMPFLFVNSDPRTVYFANLSLSFIALVFFRKVLSKLFKNDWITNILSIVLISSYSFYWLPTLAMAENFFLPLFMIGLYLLLEKVSIRNAIFAGIVTVSFYGSKYALAPMTFVYGISYIVKIFASYGKEPKEFFKHSLYYLSAGTILTPLFFDIKSLFYFSSGIANTTIGGKSGSSTFSLSFFQKHFFEYIKPLFGQSQRFLWDWTPLLPQWLASLSIVGLAVSIFERKKILFSFFLINSLVLQIVFMSTFYVVDTRYVYNLLPTLLIGFGFLLDLIRKKLVFTLPFFKEAKYNYTFYIMSFVLIGYYLVTSFSGIKKQIGLNFKYTETPWWKVSVDEYNTFFTKENNNYLIALHSPFFLDYYSNQNYQPLPMNQDQDFNGQFRRIWGEGDYSNLIELYKTKMENHNVYVTNYGINATSSFEKSFIEIKEKFDLIQVHDGCHHLCNIYQLQPLEVTKGNLSN